MMQAVGPPGQGVVPTSREKIRAGEAITELGKKHKIDAKRTWSISGSTTWGYETN